MTYNFALAGNPNSGKTTLFNKLTGSNAHVGNWPGVTVERKEGKLKNTKEDITIVDLPGIYSLSPYTSEEVVARDYLAHIRPELIINIVDATNIERNLYLTTQLLELKIPVIVALNMMDEVKARNDSIDIKGLEKEFGIPFIPISAAKGQGVKELTKAAEAFVKNPSFIKKTVLENTTLEQSINNISKVLLDKGIDNALYYSIKLLERDIKIKEDLKLDADTDQKIEVLIKDEEKKQPQDIETIIADLRYRFITGVTAKYLKKGTAEDELSITDKIDRVVTSRILGIPIFFLIMYLVFEVSVGSVGKMIAQPFEWLTGEVIPQAISNFLVSVNASEFVQSLVMDGIVNGIASLLGFLPLIILLFMCLSLLEDVGYMSRIAFVMDRIFRNFGLSGKAFVPLIMGYGCSVPGIMATRTLEDEKSRRLAITLMPFMSCGAKIPVYAVFVGAFFAANQAAVTFSIYMLGLLIAMLSAVVLNKTVFKGEAPPFVLELPAYRIPTLLSILNHTWEKAKGYVVKVGTVLLTMSVFIWFCQRFNFSLQMVQDPAQSILGLVGKFISPAFALNGFGLVKGTGAVNWQVGAALLTGFVAKEAVVSSLGILYIAEGAGELTPALGAALAANFTPLSAYAFMVFVLLYAPCVAAIATARKELGSLKWTLFTIAYQCGVAWLISMLVYQIGSLLGF